MNLTDKYKVKLKKLEEERLDFKSEMEKEDDLLRVNILGVIVDGLTEKIRFVDEVIEGLEVTSDTDLSEKIKQDKLHGYSGDICKN